MFRRDVAQAALPLIAELPHPRHRHLDDRSLDADQLDRLIERSSDAVDVERLGRVGEPVEELTSSHVAAAGADEFHGLPRRVTPGDLVPQGTQAVDLVGRVPAVLAFGSSGRGEVVPAFPRADRRHGDAEALRHLRDRQSILIRSRRHTQRIPLQMDGSTAGYMHRFIRRAIAYVHARSYASAPRYWIGRCDGRVRGEVDGTHDRPVHAGSPRARPSRPLVGRQRRGRSFRWSSSTPRCWRALRTARGSTWSASRISIGACRGGAGR